MRFPGFQSCSRLRAVLALNFLVASATIARASVIVVAADGSGNFTAVQPAIAAASDGDVLLVKSGVYAGFGLTDKALTLLADSGASPLIQGRVSISGLAATRSIDLIGFVIRAPNGGSSFPPAMGISNCAGSVRVQGCDIAALDGVACVDFHGTPGVNVDLCQDVAFARCKMTAGNAAPVLSPFGYAGFGASGFAASSSRIALYDCDVRGSKGSSLVLGCGNPTVGIGYAGYGGIGAFCSGATVFIARSAIHGGDGGDSTDFAGCPSAGIDSRNASAVTSLDCAVMRGSPGSPGPSACGAPADVWISLGSTYSALPGSGRTLTMSRVAREQNNVRVHLGGRSGDVVDVVISDRAGRRTSSAWVGVDLLQRARTVTLLHAAVIGPSGTLDAAWAVPDLGPGVAERRFYAQAAFLDTQGVTTMSTPATIVLLDSAY